MKPRLTMIAMLATVFAWPQQFEELGQKALAAAQSGHYQEAVGAYEKMLQIDHGNKGVRYDLALALHHLGRNRESLAALGKPADADSFALAGLNHRTLGDLASAERDLRAAFALAPGPQLAADFGIVLLDRDKRQEAEKVFRRYPDEVRCLAGLGLAAYAAGKNAEAEKSFVAAAAREPNAADVRASLGDVYFTTDRLPEAETAYREAIRLDAYNPEYRVKAGRSLLRLDREADAKGRFQEAIRIDPLNAEAHFELGRIAAAAHDDEVARLSLEASAAIDPGRGAVHYQLGLLYRRLGDPTRAAASMRRFEQLRNQDRPYRVDMAQPALVIEGYQFPSVHRMADGRLISFVHVEADAVPRRTMVSSDDGFSWREDSAAANLAYGLKLTGGDYLVIDTPSSIFKRFTKGAWLQETPIGVIWRGDIEALPDGSLVAIAVPGNSEHGPTFHVAAACWRSADRGHTWHLQGRIPIAPGEHADPAFTRLRDGSLYCVLGGAGPMYRTRSIDGGRIWSKPAAMAPNGVMPRLLRLGNGMLVLSSGRPGVQLRFSKSGRGDDWSEPVDVLPPTSDKLDLDSCGYTGLVALDRDTFLIVYSWFQKPDANGRLGKAVLSRRIRLTALSPSTVR